MSNSPLNAREKFLVKVAIASTLEAVNKVLVQTELEMIQYRIKTEDDPRKQGYYDTHRQFKQMEYVIRNEIEMRTYYDADLDGFTHIIEK